VPVALTVSCASATRGTDDPKAFFSGKTLTYIVATDPGGGYDTYGRLVAQYLGKHLGVRTVVVKNVPGGGHIVGTNEIYTARPDGLTLGTFNSGILYAQLLRQSALRADLNEMSWIGKAGGEPRVLVTSKQSGFRSIEDIRAAKRPLLLGASGVGTEGYIDATLVAAAIGLRTRVVLGLATRDGQLSMMRGETEAQFASASSTRPLIENGQGFAITRVGHGAHVDEGIPDAGRFVTSENGARIVALVGTVATLSRWTAGPPGIPAGRIAALRDAYAAALADPELLRTARKLDVPVDFMDGATLAQAIRRALSPSPETLALLAASQARRDESPSE
jgi:tripartite-type tricarboxylate transporter receptor subunit TctC